MLWGISDWVAGLPRTRLDYVYPKKTIPETFFDESTEALRVVKEMFSSSLGEFRSSPFFHSNALKHLF